MNAFIGFGASGGPFNGHSGLIHVLGATQSGSSIIREA